MKRPRITAGIDIGTHHTKVVVVEEAPEGPRIIGTGVAKTRGMRQGYVVDSKEVAASVLDARRLAEQAVRMPVRKGFLSIGGVSLDEARGSGETIISRADQEVTELDIEKVRLAAREAVKAQCTNRRVLHDIPLEFRLDGTKVLGTPLGMHGVRLEADYLFVTTLSAHAAALVRAVEMADIEVIDEMAAPLAESNVLLSRDQKTKGCVLVNIGADTTSAVIYDEGVPVSVKTFAEGSANITDDLAIAFKIGLDDAERLKVGKLVGNVYPRKKVDDLIAKRFAHIFDLLDKHLKAIGRKGPLPAGVILSGGGSAYGLPLVELTKAELSLPARIGDMRLPESAKVRDASLAVSYGLALWGLTGDTDGGGEPLFSGVPAALSRFFAQFLP